MNPTKINDLLNQIMNNYNTLDSFMEMSKVSGSEAVAVDVATRMIKIEMTLTKLAEVK